MALAAWNSGVFAWALVVAAISGIVLCAGMLTRHSRTLTVVALAGFTVAGVLALVGALD